MLISVSAARAALTEGDFRQVQSLAGRARMAIPAFLSLCDGPPVAPLTVAEMAIRYLWWEGHMTLPGTAAIAAAAVGGWKIPSGIDGWNLVDGRSNAIALDIDRYGDLWRQEGRDVEGYAGSRNPRLWRRSLLSGGGQITNGRRTVTFEAAEWDDILRGARDSAKYSRNNRYPCEGYHVIEDAWRRG